MFTNVNINPISPASGRGPGSSGDKFPEQGPGCGGHLTPHSQLHPTDTGHGLFVLKCRVECLRRLAAIWLKLFSQFPENIVGKYWGKSRHSITRIVTSRIPSHKNI